MVNNRGKILIRLLNIVKGIRYENRIRKELELKGKKMEEMKILRKKRKLNRSKWLG